MSCGDSHSGAVDVDGRVFTWGSYKGSAGHLGYTAETSKQTVPKLMDKLPTGSARVRGGPPHGPSTPPHSIGPLTILPLSLAWARSSIRFVAHRLATARSCLCGRHPPPPRNSRMGVPAPPSQVVKIRSGANHTAVVTNAGTALAWGYSEQGQLGKVLVHLELRGNRSNGVALTPYPLRVFSFEGGPDAAATGGPDFVSPRRRRRVEEIEDVFCGGYCTFILTRTDKVGGGGGGGGGDGQGFGTKGCLLFFFRQPLCTASWVPSWCPSGRVCWP